MDINKLVELNPKRWWCSYNLSSNPSISLAFITKEVCRNWDWHSLSYNPSITPAFVKANIDKPWSWEWLSENPSITTAFVTANMDKPWSWPLLARNNSIDAAFVVKNLHWNVFCILACEEIQRSWENLSSNRTITHDLVTSNRHSPWDWQALGHNPSISVDFWIIQEKEMSVKGKVLS